MKRMVLPVLFAAYCVASCAKQREAPPSDIVVTERSFQQLVKCEGSSNSYVTLSVRRPGDAWILQLVGDKIPNRMVLRKRRPGPLKGWSVMWISPFVSEDRDVEAGSSLLLDKIQEDGAESLNPSFNSFGTSVARSWIDTTHGLMGRSVIRWIDGTKYAVWIEAIYPMQEYDEAAVMSVALDVTVR